MGLLFGRVVVEARILQISSFFLSILSRISDGIPHTNATVFLLPFS